MGCSFSGCVKPDAHLGLCSAHYQQQRQGKALKPLQIQYHGLTEYQRFLKRVDVKGQNDCWLWTGARLRVKWHGQWRGPKGVPEPTHRAAWRLWRSEIPQGMHVLHRCDNPICVNPAHLWLGTASDNMRDMWSKGRARPKTNIGEAHWATKVTESLVRDIRSSQESGVEIARRLGITPTTVCDIRKRRSWKHIV